VMELPFSEGWSDTARVVPFLQLDLPKLRAIPQKMYSAPN